MHLEDAPAEQHTLARLRALRAAGQTHRQINVVFNWLDTQDALRR